MSIEQWSEAVILAELGDDPQLTDDIAAIIEQCTREPRQDVLLNLSGVNYQRRLKLAAVNTRGWGVFLVTGLDRIFEFVDDVPSGLAGLQMGD